MPVAHRTNDLPQGWDPDLCTALLEMVTLREYEPVPVTSGFCMYIRRAAIDAVGLFDALLFHRGYGEENDFCARASAVGFGHRLDDATFVFHEREASFGGEKARLKMRNTRVLKALHADHLEAQVKWEDETRLGGLRERYMNALDAVQGSAPGELREAIDQRRATVVVSSADRGEVRRVTDPGRPIAVRLGASVEVDMGRAGRFQVADGESIRRQPCWPGSGCAPGPTHIRVEGEALDGRKPRGYARCRCSTWMRR